MHSKSIVVTYGCYGDEIMYVAMIGNLRLTCKVGEEEVFMNALRKYALDKYDIVFMNDVFSEIVWNLLIASDIDLD